MIAIEASVEIDRSPQDVWDYVVRFDDWWLAANPDEHIELSVMDAKEIDKGTKLVLRERIAGVRGEATIEIAERTIHAAWAEHQSERRRDLYNIPDGHRLCSEPSGLGTTGLWIYERGCRVIL